MIRRIMSVLFVGVLVGTLCLVDAVRFTLSAEAVNAGGWQPGNIISDANFFNGSAMSASEVQSFLNDKGSTCVGGQMPCLKDYWTSTPERQAESGLCDDIAASAGLTAAQTIDAVARACGISQKVILVTLQKESALVTRSQPSSTNYGTATGFACPDTAPCDSQYFGFFNQVYQMARQFKRYSATPNNWRYRKGQYNTIQYNPNSGCGSSSVYIANQATANLYIYTPYQPNSAALADLYGTGDNCSAYGNRNFWRIYSDWFSSLIASHLPVGSVDQVGSDGATVIVDGWAMDPDSSTTSISVAVYRDGTGLSWYPTTMTRVDVNNVYGVSGQHGFGISIPDQPGGDHTYCVYALDNEGQGNPQIGCKSVHVSVPHAPVSTLELVAAAGQKVNIIGWSFDPDSAETPNYVALYRNGIGVGWFKADQSRPDVNAAYAIPGQHGFSIALTGEPVGDNSYCLYAIDNESKSGNPSISCRSVQVAASPTAPPTGNVEAAVAKYQTVSITGWAIDPDSPSISGEVAVYRNGVGVGWYPTPQSRTDVNGAFGAVGDHGFQIMLSDEPVGANTYCVYAIDNERVTANPVIGCRTVNVVTAPIAAPIGRFDTASASGQAVSLTGWAFDGDSSADSGNVAVYRNGVGIAWYPADVLRNDANTAYGIKGQHGFAINFPNEPVGPNTYCIYAIDNEGVTAATALGCRTVQVEPPPTSLVKGVIDAVMVSGTTVTLSGWAFDPDSPTKSTYIAIYRNGVGINWFTADAARRDVNNAFQIVGDHGFVITLPSQPPGSATYCVFGIDNEGAAPNPLLGCKTILI